ncbi:MAG: FkbM family methyltransferase, partial [Chitinophagaceae bacterium]
ATSDLAIFEQVFLRGDYDISFPFTPRTIVDAGANIGLFSVLMKSRFPESTIIAIEPDQLNFELLEKNISSYNGINAIRAGFMASSYKTGSCR